MLRGLATVSLYADDLAAAKQWYAEVLGVEAYFAYPPGGPPAYIEFRIGDYEHGLGIIDARYAPHERSGQPSGSISYWHVDDLQATLDRLVSLGAKIDMEGLEMEGLEGVEAHGRRSGVAHITVDSEDQVLECARRLLHAFAEATIPRVTLITRKSHGGADITMNSRSLGASAVLPGRTPKWR